MKKLLIAVGLLSFVSVANAETIFWQLFYYKTNSYGDLYNSRDYCMQVGKMNGWKPDEYTCLMVKK